ncbi:uncharacterized protein LOC105181790 isoform X2 [Harpegnathos saltator]|uniref:uncharacterized protein LOC105181790 isoform X2 n=1 Tax=Harpegnathos saltator TaxID=610380 RepID=UPI00058C9015|nr:uncharacterized protein LOC105181790 isoform X2 [Harpegnathos saltator]
MEYDSESSCEGRCLREFEDANGANESAHSTQTHEKCDRRNRVLCQTSALQTMSEQSRFELNPASKSLSSQVMEYYHKYSRNSKLDQYFSLPNAPQEAVKYYYSVYELSAKVGSSNRQDCIGEEYNLKSYVPRERRRWVRPPLIGQSSNTDTSSRYVQPLTDLQTPSPDLKHDTPETIHEEKTESPEKLPEVSDRKLSSPTSSVASYKPLEWDSGADVGYFNSHSQNKHNDKRLSTIERMALARGCSAALRLDPEGTTESGMHSGKITTAQSGPKLSSIPDANSTPLVGTASGSESEIEITPIVKNHLSGIITGDDIKSQERRVPNDVVQQEAATKSSKHETRYCDTPTSSTSVFKMPLAKYSTAERMMSKRKEITRLPSSPLKKSISMNVLPASSAKSSLKRSQSDENLNAKEKKVILPLIFNSSSSIATVVNKPATCDKVIQTSPEICTQESIGVQVSDLDEGSRKCEDSRPVANPPDTSAATKENQTQQSSSGELSQNASTSITPQPDETEDVSGRANSFEYFPGHTYANVPHGGDGHVSSDTGRSNSTLPNSSSSINEKLWGDSDSLVRDLERSVNILKSLVDANKCDKQVKKRLIQHVIKRLVTAKYTDDRIEHNLEDNVPWNPDDARNKVYRTELLQALAKKHSTTESSTDEWNLRKKDTSTQKSVGTTSDVIKEVALESSNSDKFDRHTDRTEMDGRKARLGLRTDDCQQNSNTTTDRDKSESSECFVPQRNHKNAKVNDIFCYKESCKLPHRESTTTNSIPPADHNRILLDAVVNNRRTSVESNNNTDNNTDWRLPTTSSERQFELKKCSMSESGDSKLVNYAEMEKRNQLIWITNEISHLCNLKKLLEQPRRLERSKSSPRKNKSANFKSKQTTALACRREQSAGTVHRNRSDLLDDPVNEPWSSHCNLATCEAANDSAIQRIMKRNSCTQTASDVSDAYSKTGGEIVSACRTQCSTMKRVAIGVGVQTSSREMLLAPTAPTTQSDVRDTKYTNSQHPLCAHSQDNNSKCRDQICQKHTAQIAQRACARCANQSSSDATRPRRSYQGEQQTIVSQQTQTNYTSDDSAAVTEAARRRAVQSIGVQQKQKEAKNQMNNASKSRCSCVRVAHSPVNDNKCGASVVEAKGRAECHKKTMFTVCPLCSKQKPVVEGHNGVCNCGVCQKSASCVRENNPGNGKAYGHASECDGASTDVNDVDRRIVIGRSRQNCNADGQGRRAPSFNEQNGIGNACDCNACQSPETTAETLCECRSSGQIDDSGLCRFECRLKIAGRQSLTQMYSDSSQDSDVIALPRKVQSSLRCNCDEACSCVNNPVRDLTRARARGSYASKPNLVDDSNVNRTERTGRKYCRACGAMYQNTRKCDCRQTYPRAVAYELSFTKESTMRNETSNVVQITPKVPFAKQPPNPAKSDTCPCDVMKRNGSNRNLHQASTLQDYLSKNNPEFVGNAETRRQYLSEICQLRELRKEKRIQLLAMASTSNIIKSAHISKPTVCMQKKISDQEMKERLRKRYLRLNEVRFKRRQQERQEEARRNKLMAKIFCKKLQQKVLRGQVDLSQSVSVISNL